MKVWSFTSWKAAAYENGYEAPDCAWSPVFLCRVAVLPAGPLRSLYRARWCWCRFSARGARKVESLQQRHLLAHETDAAGLPLTPPRPALLCSPNWTLFSQASRQPHQCPREVIPQPTPVAVAPLLKISTAPPWQSYNGNSAPRRWRQCECEWAIWRLGITRTRWTCGVS